MRSRFAWFVLPSLWLLVLGSCAHWRGSHGLQVVVDIEPNAALEIDRRHAFCFVGGAAAYPSAGFAKHRRHDELARICSWHARDKGVSMTVVPAPTGACVPCRLDWSVTAPGDPSAPAEPREGSRRWRSRRERFSKRLQLTAFHPDGPVVLEASATTWTDNADFTDDTAEVLCRALFANFPYRTSAKRYDVELDR